MQLISAARVIEIMKLMKLLLIIPLSSLPEQKCYKALGITSQEKEKIATMNITSRAKGQITVRKTYMFMNFFYSKFV